MWRAEPSVAQYARIDGYFWRPPVSENNLFPINTRFPTRRMSGKMPNACFPLYYHITITVNNAVKRNTIEYMNAG